MYSIILSKIIIDDVIEAIDEIEKIKKINNSRIKYEDKFDKKLTNLKEKYNQYGSEIIWFRDALCYILNHQRMPHKFHDGELKGSNKGIRHFHLNKHTEKMVLYVIDKYENKIKFLDIIDDHDRL